MQYAVDHYPTVRAALEQVNASTAGVSVARAAYLPRLDSLWQSNRATANNIFGQVLPQSVIPAMSGPVLPSASAQSVWGSATGALLSWEPFDFGLRDADGRRRGGGGHARARRRGADAARRADAPSAPRFSSIVGRSARRGRGAGRRRSPRRARAHRPHARRQSASARRRGVARRRRTRGGADAADSGAADAHAGADDAGARARRDDRPGDDRRGDACCDQSAGSDLSAGSRRDAHPLAQVHQAAVDAARAQEEVLARTDLPRAVSAVERLRARQRRQPERQFDGGLGGLGLDRANWAAGVQVVFPNVFDFSSLRARKAAAAASARAEAALYDEALLTVTSQQQAAAAMVQAARASPRTRRCSSPPRSRARRRRARAIRPASRASSKWPTRRACWRRPRCRTSSRASTSGARCWRRPSRRATLAPFLTLLVRQPEVADRCG